jgi:hypothetical protein
MKAKDFYRSLPVPGIQPTMIAGQDKSFPQNIWVTSN